MAIRKRGEYQYQVEIRRTGYPRQTRTFETLADAKAWEREQLAKMDQGTFRDARALKGTTLHKALDRYMQEVVPSKAKGGQRNERNRIRLIQKHPIAQRLMTSLCAADFSAYKAQRLAQVGSANTVRLELALLSHLYTWAIKEWSWPLVHVMKDVSRPTPPDSRERRLDNDETVRLLMGARDKTVKHPIWLRVCIRLALETGMRAGEILSVTWGQVDLTVGTIQLLKTKNGSKRTVGLTHAAVRLLTVVQRVHQRHKDQGTAYRTARLIPGYFETGKLDRDFKAACVAAGIENLHFHDLRHEAASRLAPHMQPLDLAKIMGWKTLQMAMRYYNPTDREIVAKRREVEARRLGGSLPPAPPAPPTNPELAAPASAVKPPVLEVSHEGNIITVNFQRVA